MSLRVLLLVLLVLPALTARADAPSPWNFAVSGDSRNCGDVVMPAIAADALTHAPAFYWHLGDFRRMSQMDEDMATRYPTPLPSLQDYRRAAWGDFIAHQLAPFGALPVYLGIGNHELAGGKTRAEFTAQFAYWLDTPILREARRQDRVPSDSLSYFHWREQQVEFISLDNADNTGFSAAQLAWFEDLLRRLAADPTLATLVVGAHRALPNSLSCGHSMNGDLGTEVDQNAQSTQSGRRAYVALLRWQQQTGKRVYVLASHSHFYMDHIYETDYWKNTTQADRGVLPGWIIGTAGATRYPQPGALPAQVEFHTGVSGYLLGRVASDGSIRFDFREVDSEQVPKAYAQLFKPEFIQACFLDNRSDQEHGPPPSCEDR